MSWSRNARWVSLNRWKLGQFDDRHGFVFKDDRQRDDVQRRALRRARS